RNGPEMGIGAKVDCARGRGREHPRDQHLGDQDLLPDRREVRRAGRPLLAYRLRARQNGYRQELTVLIECSRCRAVFSVEDGIAAEGTRFSVQCGRCHAVFDAVAEGEKAGGEPGPETEPASPAAEPAAAPPVPVVIEPVA